MTAIAGNFSFARSGILTDLAAKLLAGIDLTLARGVSTFLYAAGHETPSLLFMVSIM